MIFFKHLTSFHSRYVISDKLDSYSLLILSGQLFLPFLLISINERSIMENKERQLKDRFLEAIDKGELGSTDDEGIIVTLKEFKSA
jgi:hypothetical protein